ncbi:long-chain-fatty-acid--CoA ligase 1-like [Gastrophryne carolinensis]
MQANEILRSLGIPELEAFQRYVRTLSTNVLMGFGAFAALTTYWYATRPKAIKPPCDLTMQSVEVKGIENARRSAVLDGDEFVTYYCADVTTYYEAFQRGKRVSNNGPCLGHRMPNQPYEWISYQEVSDRAEHVGSGLLHRGCKANPEQFIGICAQNRLEWTITELACYTYSMVAVPLYDTLGDEAITYITNKAELSVVFCDNHVKAKLLLSNAEKGNTPVLRTIVLMDPLDKNLVERGKNCGVAVVSMKEIEEEGRMHHEKPKPSRSDDLAVVCFTSGTTGDPKGAMITHKNIVSTASGFLKATEGSFKMNASDVHLSYLPLAHMFERIVQLLLFWHGGQIGFFQGNVRSLLDDMKVLQPTFFPVVPRLLNRIFDQIFAQANTSLKRLLLEFASKRKEAEVRSGVIRKNSIWDKLIFHKIQEQLGGKLRIVVTGSAPISSTVLMFLRTALGCQLFEGYGQTESGAAGTFTLPGDWTTGHVGTPMACNYIKLVDVEDMNYFAAQGEGEICFKGPSVFKGYLKDDAKTAEAIDEDGWLHSGDIGKWLPNGTLKIIDRKKHIFKLAQGEYIAPEKIENIYIRSEPVGQIFVHGESLQDFVVGIVVPDPDTAISWAQKKKLKGTYEELCRNKSFKNAILEDLINLGKETGLKSFEQVKDIVLYSEMFSVENNLLTPTLKAKRQELRKYFQKQIDEIYANTKV